MTTINPSDPQWVLTEIGDIIIDTSGEEDAREFALLNDWTQNADGERISELMLHVAQTVAMAPSTHQVSEIRNQLAAREAKSALDECISILGKIHDDIRHRLRTQSTINSIGVAGERLLRTPLSILLQEDEDGMLASAPEFEIVGEGTTEPDAIADLKIQLGELFDDLLTSSDEELGPLPLSWKRILVYLTESIES